MSLYSDEPEHFIDWSRRNGEPIPHAGFARRRSYGAYLEDSLLGGLVHTGRVDFSAQLQTRVLDIMQSGSGFVVMLADGRHLDCDAVVIATGNPLPADPLAASSRVLERHLLGPERWENGSPRAASAGRCTGDRAHAHELGQHQPTSTPAGNRRKG